MAELEHASRSVPSPSIDSIGSLDRDSLHAAYRSGALTPARVVTAVFDRIAARGDDAVWISLVERDAATDAALELPGGPDDPATPLWGLPFAVKDNIDVAGLPTTAACPDFAFLPSTTSTAVERLIRAGAVLIGKTNLDQFATGLNGTRSPYGIPRSPFDESRISGGSSSGSAVAVSSGLVTFSLGTDTAGSGRVPAALTNIVGIKPSIGLVSSHGMLPACRSLDCISVFALTVGDGARVLSSMAGIDPLDALSRTLPLPAAAPSPRQLEGLVLAVPISTDVEFGDAEHAEAWRSTLETLTRAGVRLRAVPFSDFFDVGDKLYSGGWLAERFLSVEAFLDARPDAFHPVTRAIMEQGRGIPGSSVFRDLDAVRTVAAGLAQLWSGVDAVLTPTVTTTFTVDEMVADPIANNARLGRFTTFTNILDLAAIAVPAGFSARGLPFGVTVTAPAGSDGRLAEIAVAMEALMGLPLGATGFGPPEGRVVPTRTAELPVIAAPPAAVPATAVPAAAVPTAAVRDSVPSANNGIDVAVVGAHLSGMPLNAQLTDLDARLVARTTTSADYRLFALPNTAPPKPGLRRVAGDGVPIEVEVYRLSPAGFGSFVSLVPSPLAIGTLELADGSTVHGFVCEPWALDGAPDISNFGGWRAYLAAGR